MAGTGQAFDQKIAGGVGFQRAGVGHGEHSNGQWHKSGFGVVVIVVVGRHENSLGDR